MMFRQSNEPQPGDRCADDCPDCPGCIGVGEPWPFCDDRIQAEPYPFGTHVSIKPHNRHELPEALIYGHSATTGGYRYNAIFPFDGGIRFANVYSEEIADVLDTDETETARLLEVSR